MGIIQILPQDLINQIAAGEVIERPASVVKELVENAIDAQAGTITVEIEGGGIELIRVVDDGCGMQPEDVEKAVLRHATSKIRHSEDLFSIHTLGFRGEALPSILSVSRSTIATRTPSSQKGWSISVEAGRIENKVLKGMPEGTVVEVKDLFFNTPARKKFLKTSATEQRHIIDIISRYAVSYPSKKFVLNMNGRTVLNLREVSSLDERVKALWGKGMDGKVRSFIQERPSLRIYGIAASPEESRPSRSGIYTYVNNRSVKDQVLSSALIEGYRGMLMTKRYPLAVLFVDIDPAEVDVNVHPAKAEVRFRNSSAVFGLVAKTLKEALHAPAVQSPIIPQTVPPVPQARSSTEERELFVSENEPLPYKSRPLTAGTAAPFLQHNLFQDRPTTYSDKRVIGTYLSTYILLGDNSALYILDQHAAHERITYERLKESYSSSSVSSQMLLTPAVLELSPVEYSAYEEISTYVQQLGIDAGPFGENTIAIRSFPSILGKGDVTGIILELISEVLKGHLNRGDYLHDIIATMACHASIRSGYSIAPDEVTALLKDLDEIGSPLTCPHGRPLFKKIGLEEIERWIGRRP